MEMNMEMKAEGLRLEELEAQVRTELLPNRIEMRRVIIRKGRRKRGFECGDDSTCFPIRHR